MNVRVRLFAAVREAAGCESVEVDVREDATIGEVRRRLAERLPAVAELIRRAMFTVGTQYAADDQEVAPNADVACIPPVSGG